MASTNKTTNYDLSQYIGTDKPTYLTDYNQDMSKIDAGIHAAKSEADTNASAIGTLSSLTTTAKTSCVAAINEVNAGVNTNTNNIATNTSNIATNTTHIGTLTNLTTASKTDLVVSTNEVNAKVGDLSTLDTTAKTSCVAAINELNTVVTATKKEILASGEYRYDGTKIITLSKSYELFDELVIGGLINLSSPYIIGDIVLACDKIITGHSYDLVAFRDTNTYMSISFRFNSTTEIEIIGDYSNWGGNKGSITYVEGQHL